MEVLHLYADVLGLPFFPSLPTLTELFGVSCVSCSGATYANRQLCSSTDLQSLHCLKPRQASGEGKKSRGRRPRGSEVEAGEVAPEAEVLTDEEENDDRNDE